ncbi:MAG: putative ski2-type helicase [Promethearchaeota archaeon]|nr:MAG: putative ski2-type helicase [Candidatus Lokiarchaeota archaeon]
MANVNRKFFIVIDRDEEHKKDLIFNVNFFYLRSLKKKKKRSFSFISKPFFKGNLIFGLDMKNKMRPLRFNKIYPDGTIKAVNPRLFKKFLLSEKNQYVAFSSQTDKEKLAPLLEMLENFQYDKESIIELTFCKSCLDKGKFKILDKGAQIKSLKNQIICSSCALDLIKKQAKMRGLVREEHISPKLKNFFSHMILKFKDVKKVLETFKPNFNPAYNKDITIYDVEEKTPVSEKYLNYKVEALNIPNKLKRVLKNSNINTLLPIQAISVEHGLFSENENQLIMAPTSGGKTLIGELAGISKVLKNKNSKMLYLVPIVALANTRTEEFKERYRKLDISIVKKIGETLLDSPEKDSLKEVTSADLIIATYEAIDYILRSGNKEFLGNIDTILIDEIQTLIEPDRGFLLDGLIARLKNLYQNAQYLYLSATIGEPGILAEKLNCSLIRYTNRPVPVERHLVLCLNEKMKQKHIAKLVRTAFSRKSSFGYKGQTIIFTNARKKCESLATYLWKRGLKVRSYHSGLTNEERKKIEWEFQTQKIAGVVATAALAAGVDLPARQVIFESLAMGIEWLTVADFEQMLGRAGRLKKHERGEAYLLVQPEKVYSPEMEITEENIAIRLLGGKIKDFELEPNYDKSLTELLAFISMFKDEIKREKIFQFNNLLINGDYHIDKFITKLANLNLITVKENGTFKVSQLGRAIAKSFLSIEKALEVIKQIKDQSYSIMDVVLDLKPLKNVYLSKAVVADLSKNVNMKYFSNNFFSASVLSLMDAEYVKKRKSYSQNFIDLIMIWINDIFNCSCKENPYCECGRLNLERIIFELRVEDKFSINEIHNYLEDYYKILIFKGDLIDFLENLIYSFESIKNIAEGIKDLTPNQKSELKEIPAIVDKIKYIND